jgi:segregation and condensation protein B
LTERGWVKVIGHKEVPGRPSLYATTKTFLDYFSLKSLSDLPSSDDFLVSEEIDNQLNILSSETDNTLAEDNLPQKSEDKANIEAKIKSNIESNNADEPEQLH